MREEQRPFLSVEWVSGTREAASWQFMGVRPVGEDPTQLSDSLRPSSGFSPPTIQASHGETEEVKGTTQQFLNPATSMHYSLRIHSIVDIRRKDITGNAHTRIPSQITTSNTLPLQMR